MADDEFSEQDWRRLLQHLGEDPSRGRSGAVPSHVHGKSRDQDTWAGNGYLGSIGELRENLALRKEFLALEREKG